MAAGCLTKGIAGAPESGEPRRKRQAGQRSPDDLFEMANLLPEDTGLPATVWVRPRGKARHAARARVCRVAGNRMVPSNTAVVGIAPEPGLIEGRLPASYLLPVTQWITLNTAVLLRYWNGEIGTGGLMRALRPLAPAAPNGDSAAAGLDG